MNGAPTGRAVPVIRALSMARLHIYRRGRIHAPLVSFMRPWPRLCAVVHCYQGAMNGAPTGRAVPVIRAP